MSKRTYKRRGKKGRVSKARQNDGARRQAHNFKAKTKHGRRRTGAALKKHRKAKARQGR